MNKTSVTQAPRLNPCVLGTVCVPWDSSGNFLEPIFRRQIQLLHASGFENLYIFGTAGEGYAVTNKQFRAIAQVFFEETETLPGMRQLGVIGQSTGQVVERIATGVDLGFDWFQISLPAWGTVNEREMQRFFDDVLGAFPVSKFLHYNNIRCGRKLTGSDYQKILKRHPNLLASKSGGHTAVSLRSLFAHAPEMLHFLTEPDFASASLLGFPCGLLASISALNPRRSKAFFEAVIKGDNAVIRSMNDEIQTIRDRLLVDIATQGAHMDGAYDKLFSRALDPAFPLDLLSPYQGCDETTCEHFLNWVKTTYPQWLG